MRREVRDGGHDLGHAGLVVGAEQRVAARGHDVVPDLVGERRHARGIEHGAAARQAQHAAVVAAVHDRLDAGARRVRADVEVREQADHRRAPSTVAGQRRDHVAASSSVDVVEADRLELAHEHAREVELARACSETARGVARRLRVDARVAHEAVEDVGGELSRASADVYISAGRARPRSRAPARRAAARRSPSRPCPRTAGRSRRPTPAMSMCAHGTSPAKRLQELARR